MSYCLLRTEVVDQGLCSRCGLCGGVCPVQAITMDEDGYPRLTGRCTECGFCTGCCPGGEVDFPALSKKVFNAEYDPSSELGRVDRLFVGHAADEGVRKLGTSGGVVTALLLYMLKQGEIDGAVVVGMDPDNPLRSMGVLATTAEEIMAGAMSKYCLTPSLDLLREIRRRKGNFAVACLPCQAHGLRKLVEVDPVLSRKIVCILGLFCNCNMERKGHLEALRACGVNPDDVQCFQFRGGPWPGGFHVVKKNGDKIALHHMRYSDLVNVLFRLYGAGRCYLCFDALSEYADISCGDFHAGDYSDTFGRLTSCTLVFQRTSRGKRILDMAEKDGALVMHPLSRDRMSKRIIGMAKNKKNRCIVRLLRRRHKRQPIPRYHFSLPKPSAKSVLSEFSYRFFLLLRGRLARTMILHVLFSPLGEYLAWINVKRKQWFCHYHDN